MLLNGKVKDLSHPLSLANAERPNQPTNNQPNNQNRSSQSLARSASTCVRRGKNCGIVAGGESLPELISLTPDEPGHHPTALRGPTTMDGPGRARTGGRNGGQSSGGRLEGGICRGPRPTATDDPTGPHKVGRGVTASNMGNFYIKTAVRLRSTCITVTPSTSATGHLHCRTEAGYLFVKHPAAAINAYIKDACE